MAAGEATYESANGVREYMETGENMLMADYKNNLAALSDGAAAQLQAIAEDPYMSNEEKQTLISNISSQYEQ